jgi:hypothetical protein
MRPRRQQNRRRRNGRPRAGTIISKPFIQYLSGQTITTVIGTNSSTFSLATLASDLSSTRLVRVVSAVLRFAPTNATATFIQLFIVDVTTNTALPVSKVTPLSITNSTTVRGRYPVTGFLAAGSAFAALIVQARSTVVTVLNVDIETRFQLAQDTLI